MAGSRQLAIPIGLNFNATRLNLRRYYRLTKPGIVYANLATAIAGYLYASNWHINWIKFSCLVLGTGLIIAASCVANNIIDKDIDAKMERTKARAVAAKDISVINAAVFSGWLAFFGFLSLINTNKTTFIIGLSAALSYVIIYGYAKRTTKYATLMGTIPGSASLVAGYTLFSNHLNLVALMLFIIMLTWQMAHFYAISIFRYSDYKRASLPVWSVRAGISSAKRQIVLFIYLFFAANILLYLFSYVNLFYVSLMSLACLYWLRQAYSGYKDEDSTAWAKRLFFSSLKVLLVFMVILPLSRLI